LKSTGIAHHLNVGPEAEFFIFDSVSYHNSQNAAFYRIDSREVSGTASAHTYMHIHTYIIQRTHIHTYKPKEYTFEMFEVLYARGSKMSFCLYDERESVTQ